MPCWIKCLTNEVLGFNFYRWVAAQSVFYHLYNQVSYMSLDQISPLTFSIGNTMKRISVIVSSIIIFRTPIQPVNALGAAIAVFGTFLYSQVHSHFFYLCLVISCILPTKYIELLRQIYISSSMRKRTFTKITTMILLLHVEWDCMNNQIIIVNVYSFYKTILVIIKLYFSIRFIL